MGKYTDSGAYLWLQILSLLLASCVISGTLLDFSGFSFLLLCQIEIKNSICLTGLLGVCKLIFMKCLQQCLGLSEHYSVG